MEAMFQYLPQHEGLLPKWLLFVSLMSFGNSLQSYLSLYPTRRVYPGPFAPSSTQNSASALAAASPVTPLSARTFGTWTFITAVVRLYAAYNIDNPVIYQLALWTYGVAWAHFVSEWLVFKSTRLGAGLAGPLVVANGSLLWMVMQWGWYIRS